MDFAHNKGESRDGNVSTVPTNGWSQLASPQMCQEEKNSRTKNLRPLAVFFKRYSKKGLWDFMWGYSHYSS